MTSQCGYGDGLRVQNKIVPNRPKNRLILPHEFVKIWHTVRNTNVLFGRQECLIF